MLIRSQNKLKSNVIKTIITSTSVPLNYIIRTWLVFLPACTVEQGRCPILLKSTPL